MANNKRNQQARNNKNQGKQTTDDAKHKTSGTQNKKNDFH
ncbi:hypothetical protein N781_14030 [Pontibacillus halophilus JSM 076056 = DSM 19796]|uniref:Uncharacterized protein n=1 Tax=Pontibacillus halophilus JSM 076056 = DSM 19796 TaxID=1385510 RepID=A0A0A5GID9_9BACI|nr:hypothetical protein N781_14030 [Pontibacillus halophilus JSM 076056 = DSM 19796]